MIKLTRTTEPPSAFTCEQRIEKNLALVTLRNAGDPANPNVWRQAKTRLKEETCGKCAYCESATSTVAYGDVEHFRPKSVYWWLAYCYDNFSYSCQICNQMYKRAKFKVARDDRRWRGPTIPPPSNESALREYARLMTPDPIDHASGGMPFNDFVREATKEKPFLVDPYVEDPEKLYKWEADPVLKEVRIAARTNRVRATRAMSAAEEDLGLNREELRQRRWVTYELLNTLAHVVEKLPGHSTTEMKTAVAVQIRRMMEAKSEYAGMARYFVRIEWKLNVSMAAQ